MVEDTDEEDDDRRFDDDARQNAARMAADAALGGHLRAALLRSFDYDSAYQWRWLGMPIIQLPADVLALQEIIWRERPTLVIETGVARGGSVIFFASMMTLLGEGRVIGVERDLRPHNRARIADHPLGSRIALVDGSSTAPDSVARVRSLVTPRDRVMVVLDSNHSRDHVLDELRLYAPLVSPGQYLVVCDTIAEEIVPPPHRPRPWGPGNSPLTARDAFLAEHPEFAIDAAIDAKLLLTSNRGGYLKRRPEP